MPGPLVVSAPFHRDADENLDRLVSTLHAALEPDSIELEFRFLPEDRHYRRRFAAGRPSVLRAIRKPVEAQAGDFALRAGFRVAELLEGQLTLLRRIRRPWTGAERMRFALVAPFLSQILECAATSEVDAGARRWLMAAAERADAPILILDDAGSVLFANDAADALLLQKSDEVLAVFCGEDRATPLLTHLIHLSGSGASLRRERIALTNGRSLEAWIAPVDDGAASVRVLTLHERAGLTIEDVRPHLHARGVSERETEVVACVLQGMRNADIARTLFISEYTVKDHLKHIFCKLAVSSRGDLVCALHALPKARKPHPVEERPGDNLKM